MKKKEDERYVNILVAIVIVFVVGATLGSIIDSYVKEKNIIVEPITKKEEPMMYLKKPQAIKNFLYDEIEQSKNDKFITIEPDDNETSHLYDENYDENIDKPTVENVKETEANSTLEETEKRDPSTEEHSTEETETTVEETEETTEATPIINADHYSCSLDDVYYTSPVREYTSEQKELLAKMLYCEAGGEGWDCQVATLSAIINHIEFFDGNFGVLDITNHFEPASYYRYKTPTEMNWKVLDYVLSGHLIADIKYFQLYSYHNFGTPMFMVDGVYFSK